MENTPEQPKETAATTEEPEEELLYHYTTQAGLLGILEEESKNIWATHYRYLNDSSEGKAVSDAIWHELNSRVEIGPLLTELGISNMSKASIQLKKNDIDILSEGVSALSQIFSQKAFITSFSKEGNLLSQWRGYCDSSVGYSVGFSKNYLEKVAKSFSENLPGSPHLNTCSLISCAYNDKKENAKLENDCEDAVTAYIKKAISLKSSYSGFGSLSGELHQAATHHFRPFGLRAITTKDNSFREEAESRFVFFCSSPDFEQFADIKFRAGRSMITPYLEIPLCLDNHSPEVKKVIVGPCPHPEETVNATKMLLKKRGIADVEVVPSKIPYRNW